MDTREKIERIRTGKIKGENKVREIIVTHVTIRQSIFFLLLKLFLIEIFAAIFLIFYLNNIYPSTFVSQFQLGNLLIPIFVLFVIVKTFLTFFTIIQWLEEYYEITPVYITHKNGLIFKKEEKYKLDHFGFLELDQNILGRICNYGTLKLYNWAIDKEVYLYLIHNPKKYHKILESLLPEVDKEKEVFREKLVEFESDENN